MRRSVSAFVPALALALCAPAALHASNFTFTITTGSTSSTPGSTFSTSGTLSGPADPYASGAYDINAISGSAPAGSPSYTFSGIVNAAAGTNSQMTASSSGFTYNNVLYTSGASLVDANGFLLYLSSPLGTSLAHVYDTAGGYEVDVVDPNDPGDVTPFSVASFTVTPLPDGSQVPEPSTLALLGPGALGLYGVARRRMGLRG